MPSRSSIFNFETLAVRSPLTRTVLLTCAFLAAVRIAIGLLGPHLQAILGGWTIDQDYGFAHMKMQQWESGTPSRLILGSSRIALSVVPEVLTDELNWPLDSIGKLTLSAGTPWELVKLLQESPRVMTRLDTIIADVEIFQFNENCSARFGDRFDRLATTQERVACADTISEVIGIESDRLWPRSVFRRSLVSWLVCIRSAYTRGSRFCPISKRWDQYEAGSRPVNAERFTPEAAAGRHMEDFKFSILMQQALQQLSEMCAAHDIHLVIILPPSQKRYVASLKTGTIRQQSYHQAMEILKSLKMMPNTDVLVTETLADIGLSETPASFMDYGHMTRSTAEAYSRYLARQMEQLRVASRPMP